MNGIKIMLGLGIVFLILLIVAGSSELSSCVAVLHINGDIAYSTPSFSSGFSLTSFQDELKQAEDDGKVKSILIEINSPGGSSAASKELFESIRKTNKPTVSYLSEVAASGGYYAAAATKYIVANPNVLTGSIGARATLLNYRDLFDKIGLKEVSITSGDKKDIGSGYRNLTDEEQEILSGIINESAKNFELDVRAGRSGKLNEALFEQALDARVLSASQALKVGLIDEVGLRSDALNKTRELGNVASEDECSFETQGGFSLTDLLGSLKTLFTPENKVSLDYKFAS